MTRTSPWPRRAVGVTLFLCDGLLSVMMTGLILAVMATSAPLRLQPSVPPVANAVTPAATGTAGQ